MGGIYIHIPFCKQRCKYCAFYSTTQHSLQQRYVDAVCRELSMRHDYITGSADTVYFGGGTPSTLSKEQIGAILNSIKETFGISENAEITIEANPDDLTPEYLSQLRSLNINRLSMGVQSFNDRQLKQLQRRHDARKAREAVENARKAGFKNISIDLIFALPGSTDSEWADDLKQAIELRPTHISAYNLTYEEGTALYREAESGKITPLSEEENISQFETLIKTLKEANYRHYEISNFALPGFESRHNSSYWNNIPYLGCGAAAHSYNGESRCWNIANIQEYIRGIENNSPEFEIEHLTIGEQHNDTILTRLRTAEGINLETFKERFGARMTDNLLKAASKHIDSGTLQLCNNTLSLTHKGIFISDAIMRDLIYIE